MTLKEDERGRGATPGHVLSSIIGFARSLPPHHSSPLIAPLLTTQSSSQTTHYCLLSTVYCLLSTAHQKWISSVAAESRPPSCSHCNPPVNALTQQPQPRAISLHPDTTGRTEASSQQLAWSLTTSTPPSTDAWRVECKRRVRRLVSWRDLSVLTSTSALLPPGPKGGGHQRPRSHNWSTWPISRRALKAVRREWSPFIGF